MAAMQRVSDEAIRDATGKTWEEWTRLLGRAVRADWDTARIIGWLEEKHGVAPRWCRTVASTFLKERTRQTAEAAVPELESSAVRTLPIPLGKAWARLLSPEGLAIWLGTLDELKATAGFSYRTAEGANGMVRVVGPPERLILTWQVRGWKKPSTIQVSLAVVDPKKTRVQFVQTNLPDASVRDERQKHWQNALAALCSEPPAPGRAKGSR